MPKCINEPTASTPTHEHSFRSNADRETVLVAIVGYRNSLDVRACLTALARSTEINFLVSICENGGVESYRALLGSLDGLVDIEDGPVEILDRRVGEAIVGKLRPWGQLVRFYRANTNIGYAGGINVSIQQFAPTRKWSALWILNPDTEPDPEALAALIDRARTGKYSVVASRLVFKSTNRVQSYGGRWRWLMARGFNIGLHACHDVIPDFHAIEKDMDYVSGASLFATRQFVDNIGLMDERYFLYCEEVDWCLRRGTHRLGYAHDAIVYHSHGSTMGSSSNSKDRSSLSVYLDERNKLLLTRRFFPTFYPVVVLTTLLLTTQYLFVGARNNFIVALSGWLAGIKGEEGFPSKHIKPVKQ